MKTLTVALGERSYPIHIGAGLLDHCALYQQAIRGRQVMIVTDETVAPLYLERLRQALSGFTVAAVILPDGERFKTLTTLERIFTALLEARFDRRCTLLALGGGVIGDMTGFAAASYQRGVDFVQVPTTLLAQVDSSVGGKTAVNHALGKNMIGAFHQPRAVIADTQSLNTLEDRQLAAGIAEVIKYGLIRDREFLDWLEGHVEELSARVPEALAYAIERSCSNKAEIVAQDELESGVRALLNLGHTFGHAIETAMGYGVWLHGEAVAAGMAMAADLSRRLDWLSAEQAAGVVGLLQRAGLPVAAPAQIGSDEFLQHMAVDKKALDGEIRLVLLRQPGEAVLDSSYPHELLLETLEQCRQPTR